MFRIYDTNNYGEVDFVQLFLAGGEPEEVLKNIFCLFDEISDGTITKEDLTLLVKDMYGRMDSRGIFTHTSCITI